jgi:hypothetical protein
MTPHIPEQCLRDDDRARIDHHQMQRGELERGSRVTDTTAAETLRLETELPAVQRDALTGQ